MDEVPRLSEDDSDLFISQIKYDKKNYDPNLSVKIPFKHNRYDGYSDNR